MLEIAICFFCSIFHTWTIVALFQSIQKSLCGNLDLRDTTKLFFSPELFENFCFQKFEKKFTDAKFGPFLNVYQEKIIKNCIVIAVELHINLKSAFFKLHRPKSKNPCSSAVESPRVKIFYGVKLHRTTQLLVNESQNFAKIVGDIEFEFN